MHDQGRLLPEKSQVVMTPGSKVEERESGGRAKKFLTTPFFALRGCSLKLRDLTCAHEKAA